MYDEFMEGKTIEYNSIKNPYRLLHWDLLYPTADKYKYEILEYTAHRKGQSDGYWNLLSYEIRSKELRETFLDLAYDYRPMDNDEKSHFYRILKDMEPEKRTDFFKNHNHRDKYILEFYVLFNDQTFRKRYNSRVKELLVSERSESDDYFENDINCFFRNMDEEIARDILNSCGDNLESYRIRQCIEELRLEFKDTEKIKEILIRYKNRMNEDDFNYVLMDFFKGFNCERKEMYITEFSDVMTQKTLQYIFEKYNYLLKESANSVQEHAKQNPHFLYNMAKTFYDVKLKDEKFKANEEDNNTDRVIQEIPLLDRIKFIEEYKELMPEISLCAIGEDEAKGLGISKITDIIVNHRNAISKVGIIRIMEELPPRMRLEFLKKFNFDVDVRRGIIEGIKNDPNNRIPILELTGYENETGTEEQAK